MKSLKNFYEVLKRGQNKKQELQQQIKEDKKQLTQSEKDYNEKVLEGDDKGADELFDTIYELKKSIENNKKKLEIISAEDSTRTKDVISSANAVITDCQKSLEKLEKEKKNKITELEEIMETYFKKVEEIGDVCREIKTEHGYIDRVVEYLPDDQKPHGYHPRLGYHPASGAAYDLFRGDKYLIDHHPLVRSAFEGQRQEGRIKR